MKTEDRPIAGIALMLGFCVLAPMGDAAAKLLGGMPLAQVIFVRFAVQAIILFPIVLATGRTWRIPRHVMGLVVLRTLLHMFGIGLMFTALKYLPLADAVAIAFVCPFILLLLGWLFMDEKIGIHRLGACIVGFGGAMLVIQPSFVDVGWPAVLPLGVAVIFSLFIIATRSVAKASDPLGLQAVSGVIACVAMVPVFYFGHWLDEPALSWRMPIGTEWGLLLAIGLLGTFAHLLMTWSLRFAPSATLAPMQYIEIPVATGIGWLVFNQFPNALAAVGIAVTMAAGLYAVWREHYILRNPVPQA
ncbi:DMT family transporter [Epibacterium ulvae]|uniref:DMT family transporter n=1 Tax=Epibacterium ulvae TaxID=1156985 RepID=UPI001BFC77B8|nr:DMT family transporter [Epibacterium ulvae]MBT8152334.1 DMT family transporter [Epibacterium ulvae]